MFRSPETFDFDSCRELFSCDLNVILGTECTFDDDCCFDCLSCLYFMQCGACKARVICTMSPYFLDDDEDSNHG